MNLKDYIDDESYAIDGFFEDQDEIVIFVRFHNDKQKEIPEYINGKRVII